MSERSPLLSPSLVPAADGQAAPDDQETAYSSNNEARISSVRGVAILVSIFLLVFLSTCNVSVLTTIQSAIAIDLHATSETSWFVSSLLIASASVMPISGKLCQVFTERIYLLASCLLQAAGLLVSAFAYDVATFLTGRVVYGVGVAAVAPVGLILVKEYAPERWHGLLYGLFSCAYTAGIACGAIIGGALEPVVTWRAVFWYQAPVVTALAIAAFAAIPLPRTPPGQVVTELSLLKRLSQLDYLGIVTLIGSVVSLLFSLSAPHILVIPLVLSIVFLILFVAVETYWSIDPIVPLAILKSRGANLTNIATVGVMSARWAVLFFMPTYAIAVRQWSPGQAGLLLIPTNIGFGLGGLASGALHIRRSKSFYISSLACFALFAGSMVSVALLSIPDSSLWLLIAALFMNGFIIGSLLNYVLAHLLHLTEIQHRNVVIPITTMFRALAGAFGAAIAGGVFVRSLQASLTQAFHDANLVGREELISQLLARPLLTQKLHGIEQRIAIDSYTSSIQILHFVGAGLTLATLIVQAGTGWTSPRSQENRTKSASAATVEEVFSD